MRVLLDPSVLLAAHISRAGVCADLLEDILMEHELVTSGCILEVLVGKLREDFSFPDPLIAEVRESVARSADCVEPVDVQQESCRDPDALVILGSAIADKVDVLVTVAEELLELKSFAGIPFVRPGEFWRLAGAAYSNTQPPGDHS